MRQIPIKVGTICGLLGPVVFLILYSIAMASDSDYVFFENYLSDLGVGPGAWAFNSALVIVGVLLTMFAAFGLGGIVGVQPLAKVGESLLALSGILLMGVGIFNEDFDPEHYMFSISYFLTFLVALLTISASLYQTRALGNYGVVVSLTVSAVGLLLLPMGGDPQSETIAVMAMIVWGVMIAGAALLKEYGHQIP